MTQYRKQYFQIYYLKQKQKLAKELPAQEPKAMIEIKLIEKQKAVKLFYILDVLRKDLKSMLWRKKVADWNKNYWEQFKKLETLFN